MNRERAETFLRLLVEAELRGPALPALPPPPPATPFVMKSVALTRAAWALTAVGALDPGTAEAVLADAELALAARHRPEPPEAGVISSAGAPLAVPAAAPAALGRFTSARFRIRPAPRPPGGPGGRPAGAAPAGTAPAGTAPAGTAPAGTAPAGTAPAGDQGGPDRYVPLGLMILFHDETVSGELDLMSYAHTAAGARLVATWQARDPLAPRRRGLPPVEAFTVADDRGQRYDLLFDTKGRPESSCDLTLRPDPPADIRWLDITAPGEQAVRVGLDRPGPVPAPQVSDVALSAGEHLLNRIAERVLTLAPEFPAQLATMAPVPVANITAGLGVTIAALEAAEVLSPGSQVPARLAALCASLRIPGHGITTAPAPDLPEPWLSLLSHYHRRKPDTAPARDGFAAAAAALPELDGIRLVLLGLYNCDGGTWVNALAHGQLAGRQHGPYGLDLAFPLSIWIRDDAGRWHVARPAGWFDEGGEAAVTLRLTPPLTRSPAWIEVLAAGQSAEVRATVPLCWGFSS
jgi:hypothetical protein